MTKHIRVRSAAGSGGQDDAYSGGISGGGSGSGAGSPAGGAEDARALRRFTPSFLWLLRDFYLKLEDEQGRKVGRNAVGCDWVQVWGCGLGQGRGGSRLRGSGIG
jgi:hypothetical protein